MKKTLLIFVSLTTILNAVKSTGKDLDNGLELDPRQFISIYEVRDLKKEKIELWKWQDDFTNNQLRNVIDENSIDVLEKFDNAVILFMGAGDIQKLLKAYFEKLGVKNDF